MRYVVKMRKTVIYEYDLEIAGSNEPDEMVDNVVDAMDLAESIMREGLGLRETEEYFSIRETEWSPVSVNEKENENE